MKTKLTAILLGFILSCSSSQWWRRNEWGLPLEPLNGVLTVSVSLLISAILWGTLIRQVQKTNANAPAASVGNNRAAIVMWILYPVVFIACTINWYLGVLACGFMHRIINM